MQDASTSSTPPTATAFTPRRTQARDLFVDAEMALARWLHRGASNPLIVPPLLLASRLGDGMLWYSLLVLLPLLDGWRGVGRALAVCAVGLFNVAVYKVLKRRTARLRPFRSCPGITACARPLDEYSFPSGHTMHAVAFGLMLSHFYPAAAPFLAAFAAIVALSRVVLGLHYPSDVVAGAVVGWAGASLALALY